jgi:hypothetical protein
MLLQPDKSSPDSLSLTSKYPSDLILLDISPGKDDAVDRRNAEQCFRARPPVSGCRQDQWLAAGLLCLRGCCRG